MSKDFLKIASETPISSISLFHWKNIQKKLPKEKEDSVSEQAERLGSLHLGERVRRIRDVVVLEHNDTLGHAILSLTQKNMYATAAPIIEADSKKVMGLITLHDMLSYFVSKLPDPTQISSDEHGIISALFQTPIATIASGLKSDEEIVDESKTALDCLRCFADGHHEALIVNNKHQCQGLCSQLDLVAWFHQFFNKGGVLEKHGDRTLKSIHENEYIIVTGKRNVVSVQIHSTVLDALTLLVREKAHGLAVINETGRLVANFSLSDFKHLVHPKNFGYLLGSLNEYLEHLSPESLKPFCVRLDSKLGDVINELIESRMHHTFMIDDNFKPNGFLSLTDLCNLPLLFSGDKKDRGVSASDVQAKEEIGQASSQGPKAGDSQTQQPSVLSGSGSQPSITDKISKAISGTSASISDKISQVFSGDSSKESTPQQSVTEKNSQALSGLSSQSSSSPSITEKVSNMMGGSSSKEGTSQPSVTEKISQALVGTSSQSTSSPSITEKVSNVLGGSSSQDSTSVADKIYQAISSSLMPTSHGSSSSMSSSSKDESTATSLKNKISQVISESGIMPTSQSSSSKDQSAMTAVKDKVYQVISESGIMPSSSKDDSAVTRIKDQISHAISSIGSTPQSSSQSSSSKSSSKEETTETQKQKVPIS